MRRIPENPRPRKRAGRYFTSTRAILSSVFPTFSIVWCAGGSSHRGVPARSATSLIVPSPSTSFRVHAARLTGQDVHVDDANPIVLEDEPVDVRSDSRRIVVPRRSFSQPRLPAKLDGEELDRPAADGPQATERRVGPCDRLVHSDRLRAPRAAERRARGSREQHDEVWLHAREVQRLAVLDGNEVNAQLAVFEEQPGPGLRTMCALRRGRLRRHTERGHREQRPKDGHR